MVSRCERSPGDWVAARQRSVASWDATAIAWWVSSDDGARANVVRASRPKPAKLATNLKLRRKVEEHLRRRYSPEQIVGRRRREFPDDPEMRVSRHVDQSLYVQSRGALRRDLTKCLRTGRALRRPAASPTSARTASRT